MPEIGLSGSMWRRQEMRASDDAHRTLSASTDADGLPDFAHTDVGKAMLTMQRL